MLRFYGHSDDLACISGDIEDEVQAYDRVTRFVLGDGNDRLVIELEYGFGNGAVWGARVYQIAEGAAILWPVRVEAQPPVSSSNAPYSVAVVVDCPPGTMVRVDSRKDTRPEWKHVGTWDANGQWQHAEEV